jgi:prepilin signal peptidase PulO-like enzyme (type II secretory pathway)
VSSSAVYIFAATLLIVCGGLFLWIPSVHKHYGAFADRENTFQIPRSATATLLVGQLVILIFCAQTADIRWLPAAAVVLISLSGIFVIDYLHHMIPNRFLATLLLSGIIFQYFASSEPSMLVLSVDAALGMAFVFVLHQSNRLLEHWTGRQGLGLGDFKLLFVLSVISGQQVLFIFAAATILAAVPHVCKAMRRGSWQSPFAFGPYLVLAAIPFVLLQFAGI